MYVFQKWTSVIGLKPSGILLGTLRWAFTGIRCQNSCFPILPSDKKVNFDNKWIFYLPARSLLLSYLAFILPGCWISSLCLLSTIRNLQVEGESLSFSKDMLSRLFQQSWLAVDIKCKCPQIWDIQYFLKNNNFKVQVITCFIKSNAVKHIVSSINHNFLVNEVF